MRIRILERNKSLDDANDGTEQSIKESAITLNIAADVPQYFVLPRYEPQKTLGANHMPCESHVTFERGARTRGTLSHVTRSITVLDWLGCLEQGVRCSPSESETDYRRINSFRRLWRNINCPENILSKEKATSAVILELLKTFRPVGKKKEKYSQYILCISLTREKK